MGTMIKHPKDFYAGTMYFSLGAAAAYIARDYTMGSAIRMGPAYFPTMLAILLMIVGAISVVRSFVSKGESIDAFAWKEVGLIIGSIVLFGVLVRGAGLGPALVLLVLVSAWASPEFKLKTALLLAVITTVLSVLVFVTGLGLPFPILGPWVGM
ncbi:MAG: tripartite tricarboxylate transporter TctB family protein [Proteobacteria bacterium]|nr:tripartite tricarboxylate transporter TctB family protein [Pseudomonadota bacterium]